MTNGSFKPISQKRAQQITDILNQSSDNRDKGIEIDAKTGQVVGTTSVNADQDQDQASKVNAIGKFDTHYKKK